MYNKEVGMSTDKIKKMSNFVELEQILCYEEPSAGNLHARFCEGYMW